MGLRGLCEGKFYLYLLPSTTCNRTFLRASAIWKVTYICAFFKIIRRPKQAFVPLRNDIIPLQCKSGLNSYSQQCLHKNTYNYVRVASTGVLIYRRRYTEMDVVKVTSSKMLNKTQDTNYCVTLLSENTSYVYQCYAHKWWGYLVRTGVMSAFRRVWMNSTWHTEYQDAMNTSQIITHRVYCLYYFQAIAVCYTAVPSHPL